MVNHHAINKKSKGMQMILDKVKNWYFAGVQHSASLTPADKLFIRSVLNIASTVKHPASSVKWDASSDTAYTDLTNIFLPLKWLHWDFIQELINKSFYKSEFDRLTSYEKDFLIYSCFNVFFNHEKLHIVHTMPVKDDTISSLLQTIRNILEDCFIDFDANNHSEQIFYEVFYKLVLQSEMLDNFEALRDKVSNNKATREEYFDYFMNYLLLYKFNISIKNELLPVKFEPLEYLGDEVIIDDKFDDMIESIDYLYDYEYSNREIVFNRTYEYARLFTDEDMEVGTSGLIDNDGELGEFVDSDSDDYVDGALYSDAKDELNKLVEFEKYKATNSTSAFNGEVLVENYQGYSPNLYLKPNQDMRNFASSIRYHYGTGRDYAINKTDGRELDGYNLHRTSTDGKVFKKLKDNKDKPVKPDTVLLLDLSGSMSDIVNEVVSACYGLSQSLINADMPFSIWGHTTKDDKGFLMINFFSYHMPDHKGNMKVHNNLKNKLSRALDVDMNNNEDHLAIRFICENAYTKRINRKNLFVLSDGRPAGHFTSSTRTRDEVIVQRKKGFFVESLSLRESVMSANNNIYDEKHNHKAYGKMLNKSLKYITESLL